MFAVIAGVTAVGIWGTIWWGERPLHQARACLAEDPARSVKLLTAFLQSHPHHAEAQILSARALVRLGRFDEALRIYTSVGVESIEDWHAMAKALLHQQRWSEARPLLERVRESSPSDPDVLHELAACLANLKQFKPALATAEQLAEVEEHAARANLLIGTIHLEMDNGESAAKAWSRVLVTDRTASNIQVPDWEFFREYAIVLLDNGDHEACLPHLAQSLSLKPTASAYVAFGRAKQLAGDEDAAKNAWMSAVELDTTNREARESLARSTLSSDANAALQWMKPLADMPPLQSSTAYMLEQIYARLGDTKKADNWRARMQRIKRREQLDRAADRVLVDAPNSFWAKVVLAYRFAGAGNWAQAESLIQEIARDKPSEPFVTALIRCVATRGPLPSLDLIPLEDF